MVRVFQAIFLPVTAAQLDLLAPQLASSGLVAMANLKPSGHEARLVATADGLSTRSLVRSGKYLQGALLLGQGGVAEPIPGASNNGMSNYFARYSPDGRWIVFCKARSYMLLQKDSELYIIPAAGGEALTLTVKLGAGGTGGLVSISVRFVSA